MAFPKREDSAEGCWDLCRRGHQRKSSAQAGQPDNTPSGSRPAGRVSGEPRPWRGLSGRWWPAFEKGNPPSSRHLGLLLSDPFGVMHERQFAHKAFRISPRRFGVHPGSSCRGRLGFTGALPSPFPGPLSTAAYSEPTATPGSAHPSAEQPPRTPAAPPGRLPHSSARSSRLS